jgi:hypothetical protein
MLSFYIKRIAITKFCICLEIDNHTLLYDTIESGASFDPTSQVCSPTMLVLAIVGN